MTSLYANTIDDLRTQLSQPSAAARTLPHFIFRLPSGGCIACIHRHRLTARDLRRRFPYCRALFSCISGLRRSRRRAVRNDGAGQHRTGDLGASELVPGRQHPPHAVERACRQPRPTLRAAAGRRGYSRVLDALGQAGNSDESLDSYAAKTFPSPGPARAILERRSPLENDLIDLLAPALRTDLSRSAGSRG